MTTAPKISSCVDCATTIIGERLRCPACHDRHAASLLSGEEDVTLPRRRTAKSSSVREVVFAWLGAVLIIVIAAALLVLAGRSCE
jgi:RNA polymerase subunit RPABC4/transcription elongation factor Spt4